MKLLGKLTVLLMIVCLLCPVAVFASEVRGNQLFSDVNEADWFYSYVENVCEKNIMSGTSLNDFEPNVPITRAMFVTALGRLAKVDEAAYAASSFADVDPSEWYAPYVEWGYKKEIISGVAEGVFEPSSPISREQSAAIIQRFFASDGYIVSTEEVSYKDANSISDFAKKAVTICTNAGILTGGDDSTFNPAGDITRAEAAAVMTRVEEYITNRQKDQIYNEEDQKKIAMAIKALNKPIKQDMALAVDVFVVAFDKAMGISGSALEVLDKTFALQENPGSELISKETVRLMEMVVPGLYGGATVTGEPTKYFGEKKEFTSHELITGDLIVLQSAEGALMYIYDGAKFSNLSYEDDKETAETVIARAKAAKRFVVFRPSYILYNYNPSLPYQEEKLNASQKAVVATAYNYLLRGYRVQYADTRLVSSGEFRWNYGEKAPEDYTLDECGYTNCAAFVTDVHRMATGWETDMNNTTHLKDAGNIRTFYYQVTGKETAAERAEVEKNFNSKLIASDIIIIRRKDGTGHALLYVGNGNIIHSSGGTYKYATGTEYYEPSIRMLQTRDLFTPAGGTSRYIFAGKVTEVAIVRPVNIWNGIFPEDSVNRVANMQGIVAEKLSSHTKSMTVNPGEEMTFTFSVYNANDYDVVLPVTDVVPANTTYVSGADKIDGRNLSWKITVPADETVAVSYTVQVNKTAEPGCSVVSAEGKVGGVTTKCPTVQIKRSMTDAEETKLLKSVEAFAPVSENPVENANAIYGKVFPVDNILSAETVEEVSKDLFVERTEKAGTYALNKEGKLIHMLAPSMFGGRTVYSSTGNPAIASPAYEYKVHGAYYRTRLVREENLMVGDIVIRYDNESSVFYLYTGKGLMDLKTGEMVSDIKQCLESLLASQLYFAVLRPANIIQ